MAIHLKSRRGSQPEAEFLALPWKKWGGALLIGAMELWGIRLTWLQAWKRMKTSIFTLALDSNITGGSPERHSQDGVRRLPIWERIGARRGGLQRSDGDES